MKILLLGANGMLGHHFYQSWKSRHDMLVTFRGSESQYSNEIFADSNALYNLDVRDTTYVEKIISEFRPDVVVNATGVTKQNATHAYATDTILVNAAFPHQLARTCEEHAARLVLLSTDCIFSGRKGMYTEADEPDPLDLYGRTKLLGEVDKPHVITVRKSTIGLELDDAHGLIEWFLAQTGIIKGFRKAIYSGLTSVRLAEIVERILVEYDELSGIWHVASEPINKYDLLKKLADLLDRKDIDIQPDDSFICDRSLDGRRFAAETGYQAPSWDVMLSELAKQIQRRKAAYK